MPLLTRLLIPAAAALSLSQAACEEIAQPDVPASSWSEAAAERAWSGAAPGRASPARASPPAKPAATSSTASDPRTWGGGEGDPWAARAPRKKLRALRSGGEERVLCPARYHPQASRDGCACVSSADGATRYPVDDPPCSDGSVRAEGEECIFTCSGAR